MTTKANRDVWGDYWEKWGHGGEHVPAPLRRIDAAQRACWQAFAKDLPKRARVLDLGTGDGVVLLRMVAVRPDLIAVGIDSAPTLPKAAGITLRRSMPMEDIGYPAGAFDAASSQFAFEYGDTPAIAAELARVLRSGGRLRMLLHHADGPFVAHNLPRRRPLEWAMKTNGCLDRARALSRARLSVPLPTPDSFRAAVREARRLFPDQSVAANFTEAVLQTLELGRRAPVSEVLEVLDALEAKAENELSRIKSLERAACDGKRIHLVRDELIAAGIECEPATTLIEAPGAAPFAWVINGVNR